ncbi:hypothetical protein EDC01DRAFT_718969 [Geopyxis carbonaria]|nr:hypothetical protein EDC01DRAFT_718969 [Geopyxis carbonaria]
MYADNPDWEDIIPLPQEDGEQPLAQISYTEEYAEAMSYLRAMMAREETSQRVLQITEHIIDMNPAHYTVWLYRATTLFAIGHDLREEIRFVNEKALQNEKNYQIWHHRQLVINKLGDPTGETDFIAQMFAKDSKNYHVWSYRQWLVRRFDLWDQGEIEYIDILLKEDVRNNSAWNHRFFVVFGRNSEVSKDIIDREIETAELAIFLAPQNPSPWNYIRGVLRRAKLPLTTVENLCLHYASLDKPKDIQSSHALDFLVDIYATKPGGENSATQALELLGTKYDPIRSNYWKHKQQTLAHSNLSIS